MAWTCSKCGRIFKRSNQPHSCQRVPLEKHFEKKERARELFDYLVDRINSRIGRCQIVSIPCCIHLFGKYDFLAALPKNDRLEIRIALDRKVNSPRLKQGVAMSNKVFKNCFEIRSREEIDQQFLDWLRQSYFLKS